MKFALVGAGEVGLVLCKHLLQADNEVVLIEKNAVLAKAVGEFLNARIVIGDSTLYGVLQKADLENYDAFIAMTNDDAVNLLSCSLAKAFGVKKTICRIHSDLIDDFSHFNYQAHFNIDYFIDTQHVCALELVKHIRAPHRVAVEQFSRGKIDIQSLLLDKNSTWAGKEIRNLGISSAARIGIIKRGDDYIIPTSSTVLYGDDLLTLAGESSVLDEIRMSINPKKQQGTRVTITSSNYVTIALLRLLNNPKFKIKVIEENIELCTNLSENYPNISVVNGSSSSLPLLLEEQVNESDYFIACSNDDEKNIIASLQAKKAGAKSIHIWINKEDYESVCDSLKRNLDISNLVLSKHAIIKDLSPILFQKEYQILEELHSSDYVLEIVEISIPSGTKIEGLTLDQISFPPCTVLLALNHKFSAKVPGAKDVLIGGDRVVAVTKQENRDALISLLTDKNII